MKMEILSSSTTTTTRTNSSWSMGVLYVNWEEVLVSNEKGRREVHYYLKRKDGSGRDLAVIGKERTLRHMSYSFALPNPPPLLKLRSRREVLDWLSSIVSDAASQAAGGSLACDDALNSEVPVLKELQMKGNQSKGFLWLGSPWTCRKRRRHYQSFCRNGITVSVHDFIYVLAEENKRLIAYLEDLYEDSRGNKMVVVRWFHKIDEVGIVLPPDFNDREIFFSLCLQDLSVECIDGLATVLSPQHFEKFRKEAKYTLWEPFMCHRQFDNDVITAFDVTQVQGYWKQEILRCIYTTSHPRHLKADVSSQSLEVGDDDDSIKTRPRKKHCRSKSRDLDFNLTDGKEVKESVNVDIQKHSNDVVVSCSGAEICCPQKGTSTAFLSMKDIDGQTPSPHVAVGCHVEVLSQDSGIRGCWFRGVVVKRHKDKVKVRYQDIKDAVDEAKNLEEWVLASRIAVPDKLGLRLCGRTTVRPHPSTNILLGLLEIGSPVDAWWHDGWWEGIVVRKESDERVHVYFPGEGGLSIFGHHDLRCSQDWLANKWNRLKERPDLVGSILSDLEKAKQNVQSSNGVSNLANVMISDSSQRDHFSPKDEKASCTPCSKPLQEERVESVDGFIPNLGKENFLVQLRWNSSSKKRRSRERLRRRQENDLGSKQQLPSHGSSSSSDENLETQIACEKFLMPKSMKVDLENCKYRGDSVLKSSVCPLTSLVMSQ